MKRMWGENNASFTLHQSPVSQSACEISFFLFKTQSHFWVIESRARVHPRSKVFTSKDGKNESWWTEI